MTRIHCAQRGRAVQRKQGNDHRQQPNEHARGQLDTEQVENRDRQHSGGRNNVRWKTRDHLPEVGREGERDDTHRD